MSTFVLVHGAWGGGWEWRGVEERLRAHGHDVYRPTLTAMGERSHLAAPGVDLDTHIDDVLAVLSFEDLHDVVLCGQSYGGMVVTGVADRDTGRVARLVYIDALVPRDGDSVFSLLAPEFVAHLRDLAGDGTVIPFFLPPDAVAADHGAWYAERMRDHPLATMEQPLRLSAEPGAGRPCTYIRCTGEPDDTFEEAARRAREAGWRYAELPTGHDAQIFDPDGLVALLVAAA